MSLRVCSTPGCPTLVKAGKCDTHRKQDEQARGTSTERGYGIAHQTLRAKYQRRMDRGVAYTCWRCGTAIDPKAWDLGHKDDRSGYAGPECRACNRATAGRI